MLQIVPRGFIQEEEQFWRERGLAKKRVESLNRRSDLRNVLHLPARLNLVLNRVTKEDGDGDEHVFLVQSICQ